MSEARSESWRITNDAEALWAMKKITEAEETVKRWKAYYAEALQKIKDEAAQDTSFFHAKLEEYFATLPHRVTKTGQEKYDLPDGACLTMKPAGTDIRHDDDALMMWAIDEMPEVIKTTPSLDWAALKKQLKVIDGSIIRKDTGEVLEVPGLDLVNTEPTFVVTMPKEDK